MKKYTVFFSTDVQRLISADPECYGSLLYRNYRAANAFPGSLIELMLTKPDLDLEENKRNHHALFAGLWREVYRHWDEVKATYDQAHRGVVYVSLRGRSLPSKDIDVSGYFTRVSAEFGDLRIVFVMTNASRLCGWVIRIRERIIEDTRPRTPMLSEEFNSWFY